MASPFTANQIQTKCIWSKQRQIAPETYSQWCIFKRSSVLAILVPAKEHHHAPPHDVKPGPVLPRHREAAFLPRWRRLRVPLAMSPPQRRALAHDPFRPPRTKPSPLDRGEVWTRDSSPPALEGQGRRERRTEECRFKGQTASVSSPLSFLVI